MTKAERIASLKRKLALVRGQRDKLRLELVEAQQSAQPIADKTLKDAAWLVIEGNRKNMDSDTVVFPAMNLARLIITGSVKGVPPAARPMKKFKMVETKGKKR